VQFAGASRIILIGRMHRKAYQHGEVQVLVACGDCMAKSGKSGASGPARFRLVILEAESPDGDLSEVMQAAQNALRPVESAARRAIAAPAKLQSSSRADIFDEPTESEDVISAAGGDNEVSDPTPPKRARSGSPWKPRSPDVIDVDLKSGEVSFADFATQKKPSSHNMKNLVVAAWFKLYRNLDAITMDHVYTCYRAVGWPSGMADFGITLRGLKKSKLVESKGKGHYAINHIGMSRVEELNGGG